VNGKQVRLFLVEGSTGSLMTAEIMNWTGHLISAPRSELTELLKRPEVQGTGVYILIGDDADGVYESRVYIGEGDSVDVRLKSHARPEDNGGKDFWNRVVVITSKDANITKAHSRYLESRLIALARDANRSGLENGTNPPDQLLPEADRSDMEYFLAQLKIVLPVLGIQILRQTGATPAGGPRSNTTTPSAPASPEHLVAQPSSPLFCLRVSRSPERHAEAAEVDSEFVVRANSHASATTGVMQPGYEAKRESLIKSGILAALADDPAVLVLTQDHVFRSPSEAASVMNGTSENGRKRWVTSDGLSYGDWQSKHLPRAAQ
jgi:hypothetical protein